MGSQALPHVGGRIQDRPCLEAWRRAPGDVARGPHLECLEHPAPPEVLPMKQAPVSVKVCAHDNLTY